MDHKNLKDLLKDIKKEIEETDYKSENLRKLYKKQKNIEELVEISEKIISQREYLKEIKQLDKEELKDLNLKEEELKTEKQIKELEDELALKSIEDENYPDNSILEIRPGTGGEEASIFANDLLKMYLRHAENMNWKIEILNLHRGEKGIKLVTILIKGENTYKSLLLEGGVHRVQRIPETEGNGRIHTSTVTVAILPEAKEIDIKIEEKDLKIEVYRASGAGGQHVNKTESAVRITHLPTNTVVQCQDERSQHENKARVMRILRARLYESAIEEAREERDNTRKNLIGSGKRSEKIKTYNYPQNRITDHRFGLTFHNLEHFMEGNTLNLFKETSNKFREKVLANLKK